MRFDTTIFCYKKELTELGSIEIQEDRIYFKSNSYNREILFKNLQAKLGGTANKNLFFIDKTDNSFKITCSELAILKDARLNQVPDIEALRNKNSQTKKKLLIELSILLVIITSSFYFLVIEKKTFASLVVNKLPKTIDIKLGEYVSGQSFKEKIIENEELKIQLQSLASPVIKAAKIEDFKIEISLIKDNSLNAFALPGGKIFLHTGLIMKSDSADQVQSVIAHEIAHVTKRHSLKNLVSSFSAITLLKFFVIDVDNVFIIVRNQAINLLSKRFSRHQEKEADLVAFEYLLNAKIDPKNLGDFLSKLKSFKKKKDLNGLDEIFSTHPITNSRIEYLQEERSKIYGKFKSSNFDFTSLKKLVAELTN